MILAPDTRLPFAGAIRTAGLTAALLGLSAAAAWAALPRIEIAGSRPLQPTDEVVIPFPEDRPLAFEIADSIIATIDEGPGIFPQTRYTVFQVDLDGDGRLDQIAQVVRLTTRRSYGRAWWGVYGAEGREQILYWVAAEMTTRLAAIPLPSGFRDEADSLFHYSSLPIFYPAADITTYPDLNGDGKPEILVLMVGRGASPGWTRGGIVPTILAESGGVLREVFRINLATFVCPILRTDIPDDRHGGLISYRIYRRDSGKWSDMVIEPWPRDDADSLCLVLRRDERDVVLDPDEWIVPDLWPTDRPFPFGTMLARWGVEGYDELRYAEDEGR